LAARVARNCNWISRNRRNPQADPRVSGSDQVRSDQHISLPAIVTAAATATTTATTATTAAFTAAATTVVAAATTTTVAAAAAADAAAIAATTPVAATAAAVAAAAATAAEATAAAAAATLLALLGFVNAKRTAVEGTAIHTFNRLLSFLGGTHRHEREAARAACFTIGYEVDVTDGSELLERGANAFSIGVEREVSNVQTSVHRLLDLALNKVSTRP
jgi:hypothetical protein